MVFKSRRREFESRKHDDLSSMTRADLLGIAGMALAAVLAAFAVGRFILQDFPNSADEHAYLFQAGLFAEGKMTAPAHPQQEFVSPFFILTHKNKVFSVFPPGWPSILSLGVRLGEQNWVNPILCGLTIPVLFLLSWMIWGRRCAWISASCLLTTPFFLFNGGSYFSHPSCLLSILLTGCFLLLWLRGDGWFWAVLTGAAASWAFAIREMTAGLVLFIPILWTIYRSEQRGRFILFFLLGAAPGVWFYLYYNQCVTGDWRVLPRFLQSSERLGFGDREIRLFDYVEIQHYGFLDGIANLARNMLRLFAWTIPGFPLLAAWGAWRKRREDWAIAFALAAILLPLGYLLYPTDGGNQYGPRFYYESLGFLILLAAPALDDLFRKIGKRKAGAFCLTVLMVNALVFTYQASDRYRQIYGRRTLQRLVEHRKIHNAVVFVGAPSGDMTQGDLIRNPAYPDEADVIYAWDLGKRNRELSACFPGRIFYRFGKNPQTGAAFLERLAL